MSSVTLSLACVKSYIKKYGHLATMFISCKMTSNTLLDITIKNSPYNIDPIVM